MQQVVTAMPSENVAIVRALWESFGELMDAAPGEAPLEQHIDTPEQAEAVEAMLARFDPEVECRGHDGIRRFWRA